MLLATTALLVGSPTVSAAVGPKTISVDGDPSDWTGTAPATPDTGAESAGEYIWNDAPGDDDGPGTYTYPTDAVFVPGAFDLTEVRITADADNLYFLVKIGDMTNPWISDPGISLQKIGIFIDTAAGGATSADPNLLTGTGFEFWAIVAQTGWQPPNAKVFNSAGAWWPISYAASSVTDIIEASIPLQFLGDPSANTWNFYIWIGGQDGGPDNIRGWRDVTATGGQWRFGGGADHQNDPAVVDLAFSATQSAELGGYTDTTKATVTSSAAVAFGALGFVPDTTPPVISSIASSPSFNRATISWTTDELGTTKVLWGFASGQLTNVVTVDDVTLSHSVLITGLRPTTTYYFAVVSVDAAGNSEQSAEQSFTTTAAPVRDYAEWIGNTFHWADAFADDVGDGDYTYPMNGGPLRWLGKADLKDINLTKAGTAVHFNIRNTAEPTPNSDSESWRQRMAAVAIFIDQDHVFGSGGRSVGLIGTGAELSDPHPMNISVAPEFAFEYLVVADLQNRSAAGDPTGVGEMFVFNSTWDAALRRWSLIYLSTAPSLSPEPDTGQIYSKDGTEVDIWLNYSVLGNSDNWTYAIAGLLFDDAARGFAEGGARQVRPSAGDWVGGGSDGPMNPNVYDLAFYPDTAAQVADLGQYTPRAYANITRAMQVNLSAKWHGPVVVEHLLAASTTLSVNEVGPGESAGLTVYVADRNVPVVGASVQVAADPAGSVDIIGPNPATTNEFGAAVFTVRGKALDSDSTVTLTAIATVGTSTVSVGSSLVVRAVTHTYRVFLAAADGVLATGAQTTVTATFTDKGTPIAGASVTLASGNAVLAVVTASATTNAQGQASFSVRAGYSEVDIPVTLTATATNASVGTTATLSVTVKAFVHVYTLSGSASATIVGADETTTVTFTFQDAGVPRAGATVSIGTPSAGFDVVGDVSKTTDASGRVSFTLRARSVSSDTAIVVTGTASNGTAQNVATASVSIVAQAAAPVTAAGISMELFIGVTVVLAVIAAALAAMWMRARGGKPPKTEETPPIDEGEL